MILFSANEIYKSFYYNFRTNCSLFCEKISPLWTQEIFSSNDCEARKLQAPEKVREPWRETHAPLWRLIRPIIFLASEKKSFAILIWRIIFFTCKKHRLLVMITEKHMFSSKPAKKSSPLLWSRDKAGLLQHKYVTYEIVYYSIGGYIINRKLQGCLETWNSWKIFHSSLRSLVRYFSTREEKHFVSLTDHVISSLYSRVHANASLIPYWKMKETVFLYS